jgi:hypothetical protein
MVAGSSPAAGGTLRSSADRAADRKSVIDLFPGLYIPALCRLERLADGQGKREGRNPGGIGIVVPNLQERTHPERIPGVGNDGGLHRHVS